MPDDAHGKDIVGLIKLFTDNDASHSDDEKEDVDSDTGSEDDSDAQNDAARDSPEPNEDAVAEAMVADLRRRLKSHGGAPR